MPGGRAGGWRAGLAAERERRRGAGATQGAKRYKKLAEAACRASEGLEFLQLLEEGEPQGQAARVVLAALVSDGRSQDALACLRWQQKAAEALRGVGSPRPSAARVEAQAGAMRLRVRDYCAVISCLCRGSKDKGSGWLAIEALRLWRELWALGEPLDAAALRVGMNAAAEAGDVAELEHLLGMLLKRGEETANAFHILIKGYGVVRDTERLRRVRARMDRHGIRATDDTFNSLVAAFVRAKSLEDAEEVVAGLERASSSAPSQGGAEEAAGVQPGVRMYTALLQGYAARGDSRRALGLLERMDARGVRPNAVTYSALAAMAVRSEDAGVAQAVAQQAKEQGVYSSALHASLLRLTAVEGGAPGGVTAGESALPSSPTPRPSSQGAGRWQKGGASVRKALSAMAADGVPPSAGPFRALCRAAMSHHDPEGVLHVLRAMRSAGLPPDRSCLTMLMATCAKCGRPEEALDAFQLLRRTLGDGAIDGPAVRALILSYALAGRPKDAEQAALEAAQSYCNSREALAGTPSFCPLLGTVPLASDILNAQTYGALARAYCTADDLPGALGLADRAMRGHSSVQLSSGGKSFSVGPGLDTRGAEAIAELCVAGGQVKSLVKYLRNLAQHQRMLQHCQTGYSLHPDSREKVSCANLKQWLTRERADSLVERAKVKENRQKEHDMSIATERLKFWFGAPNRYYYASMDDQED